MVKVVTDNLEVSHNETEAKDLNIINVNFRIIDFREAYFNRTVLNMAPATNPIFREIKQIATEVKAMAGVLSNLEDAVMVGPIIRVAVECINISITHMTHRQNSTTHLVVYAVVIIICVLPGKTGIVSLTLHPNKTSFTPRHTITGKGVTYIKPLDPSLPLRPIEIKFENNCCCIEIHNTSDTTVECLHGQEMAYFDARSKGLVQTNNSKHFPTDQYLHDRMTPATLSPTPLAYEKPIHPTEMP